MFLHFITWKRGTGSLEEWLRSCFTISLYPPISWSIMFLSKQAEHRLVAHLFYRSASRHRSLQRSASRHGSISWLRPWKMTEVAPRQRPKPSKVTSKVNANGLTERKVSLTNLSRGKASSYAATQPYMSAISQLSQASEVQTSHDVVLYMRATISGFSPSKLNID